MLHIKTPSGGGVAVIKTITVVEAVAIIETIGSGIIKSGIGIAVGTIAIRRRIEGGHACISAVVCRGFASHINNIAIIVIGVIICIPCIIIVHISKIGIPESKDPVRIKSTVKPKSNS